MMIVAISYLLSQSYLNDPLKRIFYAMQNIKLMVVIVISSIQFKII